MFVFPKFIQQWFINLIILDLFLEKLWWTQIVSFHHPGPDLLLIHISPYPHHSRRAGGGVEMFQVSYLSTLSFNKLGQLFLVLHLVKFGELIARVGLWYSRTLCRFIISAESSHIQCRCTTPSNIILSKTYQKYVLFWLDNTVLMIFFTLILIHDA